LERERELIIIFPIWCVVEMVFRKTYEFLKELVKRGEEGEGRAQFVL